MCGRGCASAAMVKGARNRDSPPLWVPFKSVNDVECLHLEDRRADNLGLEVEGKQNDLPPALAASADRVLQHQAWAIPSADEKGVDGTDLRRILLYVLQGIGEDKGLCAPVEERHLQQTWRHSSRIRPSAASQSNRGGRAHAAIRARDGPAFLAPYETASALLPALMRHPTHLRKRQCIDREQILRSKVTPGRW